VGLGLQQVTFGLQQVTLTGLQQVVLTVLQLAFFTLQQPLLLPPNKPLNRPASAELPEPRTIATAPKAIRPKKTRLIVALLLQWFLDAPSWQDQRPTSCRHDRRERDWG
jgi:hypothetical protein